MTRSLIKTSKENKEGELAKDHSTSDLSYEELLIAFQQTEEKKQILQNAIKRLTKKQIEILRLKFFDNLSYAEISDQTSLTPRTVYNIVYEAIRQLRKDRSLLVLV